MTTARCGTWTLVCAEWRRFAADRSGATAIEYGLIVGLIFVAIIAAVNGFADSTNDMYSDISSALAE